MDITDNDPRPRLVANDQKVTALAEKLLYVLEGEAIQDAQLAIHWVETFLQGKAVNAMMEAHIRALSE